MTRSWRAGLVLLIGTMLLAVATLLATPVRAEVDVPLTVEWAEDAEPPEPAWRSWERIWWHPGVGALIDNASARWGLNAAYMRRVAGCESGWRWWVTGPGGHAGAFQFSWRTWWAAVGEMQARGLWIPNPIVVTQKDGSTYVTYDPYDPETNVEVAHYWMKRAGRGQWDCG